MQDLPDEVALSILEQVPVEDLPAFCASNKQYRRLCSDKYLWLDIFERQGLPVLEEGRNFVSWVVIYRNSLLAKKKADYFISFYEKSRPAWLSVCEPIPLYQVRHAELLGEENAELSTLIDEDMYGQQIRETLDLQSKLQERGLPEKNFVRTQQSEGMFLTLSKRGEKFLLRVEFKPPIHKTMFEERVSKERVRDILYRVCYYNLFQPHHTFFSTYKKEAGLESTKRIPFLRPSMGRMSLSSAIRDLPEEF